MNNAYPKKFGNFDGSFIKVDRGVLENTHRPLKSGVFIKNDNGSHRWLAFKYER